MVDRGWKIEDSGGWGVPPNTVNLRKIRVDRANRSKTSTEDTDTTEDTDFQLFTVLSVDFSSSVIHHSRTCQTVRLRLILTALGVPPQSVAGASRAGTTLPTPTG